MKQIRWLLVLAFAFSSAGLLGQATDTPTDTPTNTPTITLTPGTPSPTQTKRFVGTPTVTLNPTGLGHRLLSNQGRKKLK